MTPNDIMGMLAQFKSNPMQFLMQRRMNVPQNVSMTDPNAILNYLLKSGQVSQESVNRAYQMAQRLR